MADRCTQYAERVVSGHLDRRVGELEVLACKRHLNDLERQRTEEFPYYYDEGKAAAAIEFAEKLVIAEGESPKPVRCYGFQDFILGSLYGWMTRDGYRRFRTSYIEMARQNGKTFLNGINAAYIGNFVGYQYGQLYLVATKQAQARLVFEEVSKFIDADPDLGELFEVKDYISEIRCKLTNSTIRALSRDTKKIDGFRPIFGSVDEYHAHETNQMYKLLEGGTGNLKETLISIITTAGFDLNAPCYEQRRICEQILRGSFHKESMFTIIFAMDRGDDIWEPLNWQKPNPLICADPGGIDNMRDVAATAKLAGGNELRDFLTKRLNIWVQNADNQYVDVEKFLSCGTGRTLRDFVGAECCAGLDLSSGGDLTTISLEIPYTEDGRQKYYIWSHSYMPRGRLQEHIATDKAPYDIWEKDGLITVTGGTGDYKNDYSYIVRDLHELVDTYELKLQGIGYDPHNADGFLYELDSFGCPLTPITQSARFLNDATVDIRLLAKSGDLEYNKDNALLVWSFVNAVVVENSFGEIKVDKEPGKRTRRIDPVDACVDAHVMGMKLVDESVNLDESVGKYLEMIGG